MGRDQRALLGLCLALAGAAVVAAAARGETPTAASLAAQVEALKQQLADLEARGTAGAASAPLIPPYLNLQRTLAQPPNLWSHHLDFVAAVSADAAVTAAVGFPQSPSIGRGAPPHLLLGDAAGRLYFFTPDGHLLYEYGTAEAPGEPAAVTALAACGGAGGGNRTVVAVGRADGSVELLSVLHERQSDSGSWRRPVAGAVHAVEPLLLSTAADRASEGVAAAEAAAVAAGLAAEDMSEAELELEGGGKGAGGGTHAIEHLQCIKSGSVRVAVAVDASGAVATIAETGAQPVAKLLGSPALAVRLSNVLAIALTSRQAAVMFLRPGRTVARRPCAGLEGPGGALVAAVFDPHRTFRAYGFTAGGELVALAVPSERRASPCRVLQRIQLGLAPGPVALAATRDRLLLTHPAGAAAFNIAAPLNRAFIPLVSQLWRDVWRQEGLQRFAAASADASAYGSSGSGGSEAEAAGAPLLAVAGQLVITALGNKSVAIFDALGGGPPGGAGGAGYRGGGGGGGGGRGGSGGGGGGGIEWLKYVQPFVVVMMIIIGVWQFRRASTMTTGGGGGSLAAQRRAAALLDAAGPDLLGGLEPRGRGGAGGLAGLAGRSLSELYGDGLSGGLFDGGTGSGLGLGGGRYGGGTGLGLGGGGGGGSLFARRRQQQQQAQQAGPFSRGGRLGGGGGGGGAGGGAASGGGLRRRGYGGVGGGGNAAGAAGAAAARDGGRGYRREGPPRVSPYSREVEEELFADELAGGYEGDGAFECGGGGATEDGAGEGERGEVGGGGGEVGGGAEEGVGGGEEPLPSEPGGEEEEGAVGQRRSVGWATPVAEYST